MWRKLGSAVLAEFTHPSGPALAGHITELELSFGLMQAEAGSFAAAATAVFVSTSTTSAEFIDGVWVQSAMIGISASVGWKQYLTMRRAKCNLPSRDAARTFSRQRPRYSL
jgi:hypothetical protein